MTARFLITTADERTWRNDVPVVFLGEWCRRFDREAAWSKLDACVARPVLPELESRRPALDAIGRLALALQVELADHLNAFHGTAYGYRYWRILTGQWVHRYLNLIHHRWHAIDQAAREWDISGTSVLRSPGFSLAGPDTDAINWSCNDGQWSSALFGKIWERITGRPASLIEVEPGEPAAPAQAPPQQQGLFDLIGGWLQRPSDALIINSYLPPAAAAKLNLRLGQFPRRRRSPALVPVLPDLDLREKLRYTSAGQGYEAFAREALFDVLPTCFLEGYASAVRQAAALDWPSRPKFVFTSGSFDTDEVFKQWAAARVEEGRPYVTGQHGNNYGTLGYIFSEEECVATSDAFVTWGWRDGDSRHVPAFIFRTVGRPVRDYDRAGGLLLIELCLPSLVWAWDPYPEFQTYQEDQFVFTCALPDEIRRALSVRLHAEHKRQPWGEPLRWARRQPDVRIDDGISSIGELIARSRLVVHSYDSTGILETLALNIPTVCFWNAGLRHLRPSAVPHYQQLIDVGILHETALGAARHVAQVWQSVESWWGSPSVQAAREEYCARYARTSPNPIGELTGILTHVCPSP